MRTLQHTLALCGLVSVASAQTVPAPSADTTEWRFTGNTGLFIDKAHGVGELEDVGATLGVVDQLTTCSASNIGDIGGVDAQILSFDTHSATEGYYIRPQMSGWVGTDGVQQMSWVFDLYFEVSTAVNYVGLWNGNDVNSNYADFYVSPINQAFWVTQDEGAGTWNLDTWFRLVLVQDYPGNQYDIYVDGVLVHTALASTYCYNGDPGGPASWFLADCCGYTGPGHIANLAITDVLLDASQVAALGGAKAEGIFSPYVPPANGSSFCLGDDQGATLCPCGNPSDGSHGDAGCANGASAGGCSLEAEGSSSVAAADLVLSGEGLVPSQPGLYFQGNNAIASGAGVTFGDGLRCAGGGVVRLQVRFSDSAGASSTSIDVASKGGVVPGDTKRYQIWYRDPNTSICGAGFNLSNGFEVSWGA